MPRTSPELQGRTHNRRVYPLTIQNESAGLLAIEPAAFSKINLETTTVNDTLQSVLQGDEHKPLVSGVLGGSYWALKGAGLVGAPTVPVPPADLAGLVADPEDAANASLYVAEDTVMGIVMEDLAGSRYESVGGADSELAANYYDGSQGVFDMYVYETNERVEWVAGDPAGQATIGDHTGVALVYAPGDVLFVDARSGLLTNRLPLSLRSADSVTAGVGATPALDGTFDPATMVAAWGAFGFRADRVINGVIPVEVAEVIDTPSAEYRALRIRTKL